MTGRGGALCMTASAMHYDITAKRQPVQIPCTPPSNLAAPGQSGTLPGCSDVVIAPTFGLW